MYMYITLSLFSLSLLPSLISNWTSFAVSTPLDVLPIIKTVWIPSDRLCNKSGLRADRERERERGGREEEGREGEGREGEGEREGEG